MPLPTDPIGARLRARRTELEKTLAQVAEESGLSIPYISNLERGRGNPTVDVLTSLAGALDISVSSLLGDVDPAALDLANVPPSLLKFSRTTAFKEAVAELAMNQSETQEDMQRRILIGMSSAPRRSTGEPSEDDWRRLLDAYSLILKK
ncbi:MAG: helix-turn-helix domain-containing protein [Acidimicrobiales bacterium]